MSDEKSKVFGKETPIIDLDVEQFTSLMLSITETKSYITAQREQEVANRIFRDAEGLILAAVQPFRATTAKDVDEFAEGLKSYLRAGGKGTFVIAAALMDDSGKYKGAR